MSYQFIVIFVWIGLYKWSLQFIYKLRCYKLMVMLAKTLYQNVSVVFFFPANFDKCCSIQQLSVHAVLFDRLDVNLLIVWWDKLTVNFTWNLTVSDWLSEVSSRTHFWQKVLGMRESDHLHWSSIIYWVLGFMAARQSVFLRKSTHLQIRQRTV